MNVSLPVLLLATTLVACTAGAQAPAKTAGKPAAKPAAAPTLAPEPTVAPAPAASLAPFVMARYVVGLVRPGPSYSSEATPEALTLQTGHMMNIDMLVASGQLVVAGPLVGHEDAKPLAGLFIFRVATIEEARELLAGDPAVAAGRLEVEFIQWMAPSTLRI